ncbi:MAG: hypothetical protein BWY06_00396 [Candidatus Latescibacteria bacterium ADurb.Bin168]|nr:MAG: hypothetical protein BWY06_00396 [Candidatus Latescibacteria bacterium ADurb.Bin168]
MSERFETEFSVRSYELDAALDAPPLRSFVGFKKQQSVPRRPTDTTRNGTSNWAPPGS